MAYWTHAENQVGVFTECETGNHFEFSPNNDGNFFGNDFAHIVWVLNGYRYANVKKTVLEICIDEDENGPVVQKWHIRNKRDYK